MVLLKVSSFSTNIMKPEHTEMYTLISFFMTDTG